MNALRTLSLAAVLAVSLSAQTTILVGPNGLPGIAEATVAASSGDVILVEPGTYPTFTVTNKSITIRAITPGTVTVSGGFVNIVFGGSLHLADIDLRSIIAANATLTMDRCSAVSPNAVQLNNVTCHLQRCRVVGQTSFLLTAAITAQGSRITAVDTIIEGAPISPPVRLVNSTFLGSGLQIVGAATDPVPAFAADAESTLWLADSSVSSNPSVCPIAVAAGRTFRTTLSPDCGAPPTGLVLGVHAAQPPQAGAPLTLGFRTGPFHPVAVFASPGLATTEVASIEQAVSLDLDDTFFAGIVFANAQGSATATWNLPASPALVDTTLWLQGLSGLSLPLQASAVAGGLIR